MLAKLKADVVGASTLDMATPEEEKGVLRFFDFIRGMFIPLYLVLQVLSWIISLLIDLVAKIMGENVTDRVHERFEIEPYSE
jgi:hypothetical protein